MSFRIQKGILLGYTPDAGETEVIIPEGVTCIDSYAFKQNQSITRVVIPKSVRIIFRQAFMGCSSLVEVCIPETVTKIEFEAFEETPWLKNYPDNFVIVGNHILLRYKGDEKNVIIPEGIKTIGEFSFRNCESIQHVDIPDTVTSIGRGAFAYCKNLQEIVFSENIKFIGMDAFYCCSSLEKVSFPNTDIQIQLEAFLHTSFLENYLEEFVIVGDGLLLQYKGTEKSLTIPKQVKIIEEGAFSYCSNLIEVVIPEGVKKLENRAFYQCHNIQSITIPKSITSFGKVAFSACSKIDTVQIGENKLHLQPITFLRCKTDVSTVLNALFSGQFDTITKSSIKYPTILDYFIVSGSPEAETYIRENINCFMDYFIEQGDKNHITLIMESTDFLTAENIDDMIDYAIDIGQEKNSFEIQLLLTDYKANHFGFADLAQRFKL